MKHQVCIPIVFCFRIVDMDPNLDYEIFASAVSQG